MKKKPNLYQVLQVDPRADTDLIRLAYRYLADKYHPTSSTGDTRMFDLVADAWRVLHDDATRAEYDEILFGEMQVPAPQIKIPETKLGLTTDEFKIAILQVLLSDQQKGIEGGIFDSQLIDIFPIDMFSLKSMLSWLEEQGFINNIASRSTITETGIKHLNGCLGAHKAEN